MKATIKKISMKTVTPANKPSFNKIVIEADVVFNDKGEVRTYKSEMSPEYAKKYFNYCGVSSKQAIGMKCEVTLRRREYEKDGEIRTFTEIKYLNLLDDESGKPIIMPKETSGSENLGF